MEGASIALAVVPLIAAAVTSYSDLSNAVRRYRHFSDELDELFADLNVQSTIFRTAVQLLFASFVGMQEAADMLTNEKHPKWEDPDLELFLESRFENRCSAVTDSISLLHNRLAALQKLCDSFHSIVQDVNKDDSIPVKKSIRRIGKKIKLCCSQSRVESLVKSVKERTQDFRILVQQSERIAAMECSELPSAYVQAVISRFGVVKLAANDLYEALGKVCAEHLEHKGYIGLEPSQNDRNQINFVLAMTGLTIHNAPTRVTDGTRESIVWMTIESEIDGTVQSSKPGGLLKALNNMAKRSRPLAIPSACQSISTDSNGPCAQKDSILPMTNSSQIDCTSRKSRKVVAVDVEILESSKTALQDDPIRLADPLPNLCHRNNFCNLVQNVFRTSALTTNKCVGYLKIGSDSKHLVYINSRTDSVTEAADGAKVMALRELLNGAIFSTPQSNRLSQLEQCQIAKQLSVALLRYHNTKWLQDFWSSNDIIIRKSSDRTATSRNRKPTTHHESYASTSIRIQNTTDSSAIRRPSPYVRNRALFNLGKMLLELAYEKPFDQLRDEEDYHIDPQGDPDYFTANRLRYSVSSKAGLEYSELVRRCIECDFGQGHDLSNEALQASFYHHVFVELERCEANALRVG